MTITPTSASQPILKNEISDIFTTYTDENLIIDLFNNFDDPSTTGKAVRFEFDDSDRLAGGIVDVILYDQQDTGAPITVENFLNYVTRNSYDDSIIHRAPSSFVVQGGSYTFTEQFPNLSRIPTDAPIQNEYSPQRDNIIGTIAMAKIGGNPNSATSGWFFNVNDNTEILNENQNGGFTTFGQIINDSSLNVVSAIAGVEIWTGNFNIDGNIVTLEDIPLFISNGNEFNSIDDYVRLSNIEQFQLPELTFSVVSNSNPDLVNVSLNGQQMVLDYLSNVDGSAEITIEARNIFGQTIQDSFLVELQKNDSNNNGDDNNGNNNNGDDNNGSNSNGDDNDNNGDDNNGDDNNDNEQGDSLLNTPFNRFRNKFIGGTYLFANQAESETIIRDHSDTFEVEGEAFQVSQQPADGLVKFNRFRNKQIAGTYLFATETESQSILRDYPTTFELEGTAFYAYGADAGLGTDYYRLANLQVPGTYLFVNETEKNSALAQFPNLFSNDGVAFEVG